MEPELTAGNGRWERRDHIGKRYRTTLNNGPPWPCVTRRLAFLNNNIVSDEKIDETNVKK